MAVPESGRGAILDAQRLIAFKLDEPVNVLILYNEKGQEIIRIDHWWSVTLNRGRGKNFNEDRIKIVEDGTALDAALAATDSIRYQIETAPVTLSEVFSVRVADRPQAGRNREWGLVLTTPKFKNKFMGSAGVNR